MWTVGRPEWSKAGAAGGSARRMTPGGTGCVQLAALTELALAEPEPGEMAGGLIDSVWQPLLFARRVEEATVGRVVELMRGDGRVLGGIPGGVPHSNLKGVEKWGSVI